MIVRFIGCLLLLVLLTATVSAPVTVTINVTASGSNEEFVGPFPNWINALTGLRVDGTGGSLCTGATGDGSVDDTAALQSCLNILGATNPILWVPTPSVRYKISDNLTTTGTASSGAYNVTVASSSGIVLGMVANGTGVPSNDPVVGIIGNKLTLRNPVTSSLSSTSLHFSAGLTGSGFTTTTATALINTNTLVVASASGISIGMSIAGDGLLSGANSCHVSNIVSTTVTLLDNNNTACNTTAALSATQVAFYNAGGITLGIIGENPANTKLLWAGSSGGTMLSLLGVTNSRVDRITFDGNSTAGIIIDDDFDNTHNYFPTADEFADDTFTNSAVAFRCGLTGGCSETAFLRDTFSNNSLAGLSLRNQNALDIWVWYSTFTNNARGVTNALPGPGNAGNFHVFNSNFFNSSVGDITTGSTGIWNFVGNFSSGSFRFISGGGSCAPDPVVLRGNTVINTTDPISIHWADLGPMTLIDNNILSLVGVTSGPVVDTGSCSSDLYTMGNNYTAGAPGASLRSAGRIHTINDTTSVSPSSINSTPPTLPGTPPNLARTIIEVVAGSSAATIQAAICQAATGSSSVSGGLCTGTVSASRAVVHLQGGSYSLTATLTVPANADIQIIGDGGTSLLSRGGTQNPILRVNGPSKVVLRDFDVQSTASVADGIEINTVDQAGSQVWGDQIRGTSSFTNYFIDALDRTTVEFHNVDHEGGDNVGANPSVVVTGGPSAAMGTWLGGATNFFLGGSTGNDNGYSISSGAHLLVEGVWNDAGGTASTGFIATGINTTITYIGSALNLPGTPADSIKLTNFQGVALLSGLDIAEAGAGNINISGTGSGASVLGVGMAGPNSTSYWSNTASPANTSSFLASLGDSGGGVFIEVPEINSSPTTPFLVTTMGQFRATNPSLPLTTASGVTSVQLHRITSQTANAAWHIKN